MLCKYITIRSSGCLNTVLVQLQYTAPLIFYVPEQMSFINLWIYHLFFSLPLPPLFFTPGSWFRFQQLLSFALDIQLNVICLHKAMAEYWGKQHQLLGQSVFAFSWLFCPSCFPTSFLSPPSPPLTSLIFICAHFLSWPWMELSSCSVQLYVYWIYSIMTHCACVSILETGSAFLEERLLFSTST